MNNRTNNTHDRHTPAKRLLCGLMAALLLLICLPATVAQAAGDGMIRVKLTKLGSGLSSITLRTSGGYACAGKTIASGSTVKVEQNGSSLTLSVNGQQVTSGSQIALNRLSGGLSSGVKFTSPSKSNTFHADLIFSVNGGIQTVARMYIETYLYGVVGYEMSNSYPIEALKAQAVAARTYALRAKKSSGSYDVTDNTNSQVFYGYSASQKNVISAVDGTRGVCLTTGSGAYAQCFYTASNGGQTESTANIWGGSASYLVVKDDPYDLENPGSRVKSALIPKNGSLNAALAQALLDAADSQLDAAGLKSSGRKITGISEVTPHTPKYAAPSRVYTKLRFTLTATDGKKTAQATVNLATFGGVEDMLGLSINSSSNEIVSVEESGAAFTLSFRRFGHGVGMSQRGAQQMAGAYGKSYKDILSFYYPGTKASARSLGESLYGAGGEVIGGETDPEETLSYGSSGEAVKELQRNLQALGFFEGNIGGNYLTLTEQAVRAYQSARGLTADGAATPELQKRIAQEAQGGGQPTPAPEQYPLALIQMPNSGVRLNVRKGPGTGHKIVGRVTHGTQVEVTGASGSWSQIRTGELEGYVMTSYLQMIEATATPAPSETPAPDGETLSYGSSGEAVKALQRRLKELGYFGGEVGGNYLAKTQEAVQAFQRANGLNPDGIATPELQKLIFGAQATATPAPEPTPEPTQAPETGRGGVVNISGSKLNLRQKASTSSKILARLSGGTRVTVLGESGNWYHVDYNGTLGYLSRDYVRVTGEAPTAAPTNEPTAEPTPEPAPEPTQAPETGRTGVVNISGSKLNLRQKASTSSKILARLSGGTRVTVLGESGGWYHVNYSGTLGYLSKAYVRVTGDANPTATQAPEASREATIQIENGGTLHLRKGPGTDTESLGYVQDGDKAVILGESGEWYRVRVDGKEGYLKKIYLDD